MEHAGQPASVIAPPSGEQALGIRPRHRAADIGFGRPGGRWPRSRRRLRLARAPPRRPRWRRRSPRSRCSGSNCPTGRRGSPSRRGGTTATAARGRRPGSPACRSRIAGRCGVEGRLQGGDRPAIREAFDGLDCAPSACTANIRQAWTARPSRLTMQAPQAPTSQPRCMPVSPRSWRRKSASDRRGSTSQATLGPLTREDANGFGASCEASGRHAALPEASRRPSSTRARCIRIADGTSSLSGVEIPPAPPSPPRCSPPEAAPQGRLGRGPARRWPTEQKAMRTSRRRRPRKSRAAATDHRIVAPPPRHFVERTACRAASGTRTAASISPGCDRGLEQVPEEIVGHAPDAGRPGDLDLGIERPHQAGNSEAGSARRGCRPSSRGCGSPDAP